MTAVLLTRTTATKDLTFAIRLGKLGSNETQYDALQFFKAGFYSWFSSKHVGDELLNRN
jgi:hypothetical protein